MILNMDNMEKHKQPEKIEIVEGNGKDLNISPVYEHIKDTIPKSSDDKPRNIVVPKNTKKENKSDN